MPASPIRKLDAYAEEAKQRGLKVYHLNIGQPDISSPKEAIDAVKAYDRDLVSYTNSKGNLSFRKKLAEYYRGIGIDVDEDCINLTGGGSEAIMITLAATCDPDDEVIVFEPFYTNYNSFALQNDVRLVPITTYMEDGFALPPMSEVEKRITPRTKGVLICNPGNPTGCLYTKEALLELGRIVKKHNLFLISDEVYREYCYTDEPHFSCMHIPGIEDNVVLIDSVSKRYSLCGARIGFIVSKNREFMDIVLRYAQARLCVGSLGQIAGEGALHAPEDYCRSVRQEYMERRNVLVEGLNRIPGVKCPVPMGAFYAAVELPVDNAEKFAVWLLKDFSYDGQTLMVAPMAGFYANYNLGKRQVRMAYVINQKDLKAALRCLEVALAQYPGRRSVR